MSEFPKPTDAELVPGQAADHQAAIEGEVWQALQEGVEHSWLTETEAQERFTAWYTTYHPEARMRHPNRHEKK